MCDVILKRAGIIYFETKSMIYGSHIFNIDIVTLNSITALLDIKRFEIVLIKPKLFVKFYLTKEQNLIF